MSVVWVALIVLAQVWVPALLTFAGVRRYAGASADTGAALALAFAPVLTCLAVTVGSAVSWRGSGFVGAVGSCLMVGAALGPWRSQSRELLRTTVARLWLLTASFWLGQELLIHCHGRGYWAWDWSFHAGSALSLLERTLRVGMAPLVPGRSVLLGIWAGPALGVEASYWVFQVTTVVANSLVVVAAYLWGERLSGSARGGYVAWALVVLCAGLTQNAIFTWPKVLSAYLTVLAMYAYARSQDDVTSGARWGWEIAAGVAWGAAFHAHTSAAGHAAVFFLLIGVTALRRPRRFPWAILALFATFLATWAYGLVRLAGPMALRLNPYFSWSDVGTWRQLEGLRGALVSSVVPVAWGQTIWAEGWVGYWGHWLSRPDWQDQTLRATTDVLLVTLPLIVTAALFVAGRGWLLGRAEASGQGLKRSAADRVSIASLALSSVLAASLLRPADLGVLQAAMNPALLMLLCAASGWIDAVPLSARSVLWGLSLLQYLVLRGVFLLFNVLPAGADEVNLKYKAAAHLVFASDYGVWVVVGAALLVLASLVGLLLTLRAVLSSAARGPAPGLGLGG